MMQGDGPAMAGKPKGVPRDQAIALRLPRELRDRLGEAAAGRSVSEEIRARLEWSLLYEWRNDDQTRRLTDGVAEIARNVKPYYGPWHENAYAFLVFQAAVAALLSHLRPKGVPVSPPEDGEFRPGATPEAAGVALAQASIIAMGDKP
jgi:hypothetical protein